MINTKEPPVAKATPCSIVQQWMQEEFDKDQRKAGGYQCDVVHIPFPDFIREQMATVLATSELFEQWLDKLPQNAITGGVELADDCPLANFLRDYFYTNKMIIQALVGKEEIEFWLGLNHVVYSSAICNLPWAEAFVCRVDQNDNFEITVADAKRVIEHILLSH